MVRTPTALLSLMFPECNIMTLDKEGMGRNTMMTKRLACTTNGLIKINQTSLATYLVVCDLLTHIILVEGTTL